jgi:hypothetical protein
MAGVQAQRKRVAEDLLAAVKKLSTSELREFEQRFAAWRGQNGADPSEETLLTSIRQNSTLPPAKQRRLELLRRKHQAEHLTKGEENELQGLWQNVEQMNVSRLCALTELAQRRGTDVKTLMCKLGLSEKFHVF